jgi:hypothetical protein
MSVALAEPVDVLSSGLADVREMLPGLDDEGILRALRDIETHLRQTQSVMLELVAEADSRRIAARAGFDHTASGGGNAAAIRREGPSAGGARVDGG